MSLLHDTFAEGASQNVTAAGSAGASAASTAFGAQTRWIRICCVGIVGATLDGVRYVVGDGTPTATASSSLLPLNWPQYITVNPGQKIAVLGNNTTGTVVNIVELVQ